MHLIDRSLRKGHSEADVIEAVTKSICPGKKGPDPPPVEDHAKGAIQRGQFNGSVAQTVSISELPLQSKSR